MQVRLLVIKLQISRLIVYHKTSVHSAIIELGSGGKTLPASIVYNVGMFPR